jgi:hypothetical protein
MPKFDKGRDNLKLLQLENTLIQSLPSEYNVARQAGNTLGFKHVSRAFLNFRR